VAPTQSVGKILRGMQSLSVSHNKPLWIRRQRVYNSRSSSQNIWFVDKPMSYNHEVSNVVIFNKHFPLTVKQIYYTIDMLEQKILKSELENRICTGFQRARSSAWLERQAHNLVVKGSNPFGPTKSVLTKHLPKPCLTYVIGECD
jgi:hypothetical protein